MNVPYSWFEIACKNGLAVVLAIGIFVLCAYLVKHIAEQLSERMKDLCKMIQSVHDAMEKHDAKADERGRYIREEHRQMIDCLGRINGYK